MQEAFSADEQNMIQRATVTADKNPEYDTSPGNGTTDKVFLLSVLEAQKYLSTDDARKCMGSAYCDAQGASKGGNGACIWWLRSPGARDFLTAFVSVDGRIIFIGGEQYSTTVAVRPALWIEIK